MDGVFKTIRTDRVHHSGKMESKSFIIFVVLVTLAQKTLAISEAQRVEIENARDFSTTSYKEGIRAFFTAVTSSLEKIRNPDTVTFTAEQIRIKHDETLAQWQGAAINVFKSVIKINPELRAQIVNTTEAGTVALEELVRLMYAPLFDVGIQGLTYLRAQTKINLYESQALPIDVQFVTAFGDLMRSGRVFEADSERQFTIHQNNSIQAATNFISDIFRGNSLVAKTALQTHSVSDSDFASVNAWLNDTLTQIDIFTNATSSVRRLILDDDVSN